MMIIPRLPERLTCMLYRRKLELDMEELKPDFLILRAATEELKQSIKLKKILAVRTAPVAMYCDQSIPLVADRPRYRQRSQCQYL